MAESTTHVPLIQPTQIQPTNIAGSVIEGYTQGQNLQLRQLQMQGLEQERAKAERQEQAVAAQNQLRNLAAAGDSQALQKLAAYDPAGAKGIQDEMNRKVVRVGQLASTVKGTSLPNRPKAYEYARKQAELEGYDVSEWPDKYDRSVDSRIDFLTNSARDIEKMQEDPKREADIASTRANTSKTYEEISNMRDERRAAQQAGIISPTGAKKYQETINEDKAKKQIALPKLEAQAETAVKLIDDIVSHPGMKSMVGAKNPFSGAARTMIPFTDKNKPFEGSDSANFMAKFEQLEGKQFLEAYETLKGGGSITEIEGAKATKAISSMRLAQSEKEFKAAAKELKEIIQNGVRRARGEKVYESGGASKGSNPYSHLSDAEIKEQLGGGL